jgi:diacylglycerol kinase
VTPPLKDPPEKDFSRLPAVAAGKSAAQSPDDSPSPSAGDSSARSPLQSLIQSFRFAITGLLQLLKTQRNARIELFFGICACAVAGWLKISRAEWAVLVFTIALVLILEGLNTSIEAAVDLASPEWHPLAKTAKDLAAGMVLIAALASIAIGLLILGPPLWHKFFG